METRLRAYAALAENPGWFTAPTSGRSQSPVSPALGNLTPFLASRGTASMRASHLPYIIRSNKINIKIDRKCVKMLAIRISGLRTCDSCIYYFAAFLCSYSHYFKLCVCAHACMYMSIHVCTPVCENVCMYLNVYEHVCVCVRQGLSA